jgi:Zn-dependent protease
MKYSKTEIMHLLRAWFIISLAFSIAFAGFTIDPRFLIVVLVALFTVGVGFVFHELGHKYMAQKYGCWAEFRANNFMLGLALVFSFFGFIFAAPGGVYIKGYLTKRKTAYISLIGPVINLAVGLVFGLVAFFAPITQVVCIPGMMINFWLGLFNLLPFPLFDGFKVYRWNKGIYAIFLILAVVLTFGSGFFFKTTLGL